MLWFDVEKSYKTMNRNSTDASAELWFDVEKSYKTMLRTLVCAAAGCGLM